MSSVSVASLVFCGLRKAFVLVSTAVFSLLFAVILSFGCAYLAVRHGFSGTAGERGEECLVVFGAAVQGMNRPGPAMARRVREAVALYREGSVRRVFLTGGRGGLGYGESEAAVMFREAVRAGIPPSAITLEETSTSTIENLTFTRPLTAGCSGIVGISDAFHLARIHLLAQQLGWRSLRTRPAGERPPEALEARSVLREVLGYVYYAYHLHTFVYVEA